MRYYVLVNTVNNFVVAVESKKDTMRTIVEETLVDYFPRANNVQEITDKIMTGTDEDYMLRLVTYDPKIVEGSVIQIVPEHKWGGALAIVVEVESFGVQAYVEIPMEGQAYILLKWNEFTAIGTSTPFVLDV